MDNWNKWKEFFKEEKVVEINGITCQNIEQLENAYASNSIIKFTYPSGQTYTFDWESNKWVLF